MNLLSLDTVREQIEREFTPEGKRRALDWARTTEGRECLEAHRAELAKSQPRKPEPRK